MSIWNLAAWRQRIYRTPRKSRVIGTRIDVLDGTCEHGHHDCARCAQEPCRECAYPEGHEVGCTLDHSMLDYALVIEAEHIPVRGNFCTEDADADRELEDEICDRLDRGDLWAWCSVRVCVVDTRTQQVAHSSWLGGCSYKDEADFKQCGYYEDMCAEAREALFYPETT